MLLKTLRFNMWSGNSTSKLALERQHDVDAGVRSHSGLVQILLVGQGFGSRAQPAVFFQNAANARRAFINSIHSLLEKLSLRLQIDNVCSSLRRVGP